jgi:hypothetical protein
VTARTHRFPLTGFPRELELRNPAGSTTVRADPSTDELVVEVEALNSAAAELIDRLDVVASRDSLRVSVPERRLLRTPAFAITVTTPPDAAVRVSGASADATLRGRLGSAVLTSSSGDLSVGSCSDLQARAASGHVRAGRVAGRTTVANAAGDVEVSDAGGPVEVRTASGDVLLGTVATDVAIRTASGDVRIHRAASGTVRLTTVSGNATVSVATGLRIWLDVQTVSGRMDSELQDEGPGAGHGAPQLTVVLHSVSGDLRLRRAVHPAEDPPTPPAPPTAPVPPSAPAPAA